MYDITRFRLARVPFLIVVEDPIFVNDDLFIYYPDAYPTPRDIDAKSYGFVVRADLPRCENGNFQYSPMHRVKSIRYATHPDWVPYWIRGVYHPGRNELAREYYEENALDIDYFAIILKDLIRNAPIEELVEYETQYFVDKMAADAKRVNAASYQWRYEISTSSTDSNTYTSYITYYST